MHGERFKTQSGQVMLLTMLVLSGTLLGATAIAGLLTVYQLRQATSAIHSVRAIYAADAGIELERYRWYKDRVNCHGPSTALPTPASSGWPHPVSYPPVSLPPNDCYGPGPTSMGTNPISSTYTIDNVTYTVIIDYQQVPVAPGVSTTTLKTVRSIGQSLNAARALQFGFPGP